jgi:hypothetical protein
MGKKEHDVILNRLLSLQSNERLFRINSGWGWTGELFKRAARHLVLRDPRPFRGAPEGWPDLVGWESITIPSDMIGKKIAIFKAEEVKATGRLSKEQRLFRDCLTRMGGQFQVIK